MVETHKKIKDLSYQSFIGKDLRGVDFSNSNLKRAIFDRADLEGANLSNSDLSRASFRDANLMKAALDGAILDDADFRKAKLSLANLQNASLNNTDLRGIRGRYAIWRNTNWWDAKMNDDLKKALDKKWPQDQSN